ncbi:MAG: response regulator [candidate division WOR-3 bacterium]|nr:response regulator [candidate division WOR-3 bacterium]MCX7946992.1 response regulator [candidate division WOR-3 bacterium]MDW8149967.1 response regulator [candidate division WOR-3 bacterium]
MRRIMIVDDEEDIVLGLSRYLKKNGYDVVHETSPKKALEILSAEPVDILIADVKMDEMSGLELINQARQKNSDIKVIIMTARGSEEVERISYERGALEYLEKPFDVSYLLEVLKKIEVGGFKGVVKELGLVDFLNILNMERAIAVVNVTSAIGSGKIYFENGEIVHSQFQDKEGINALKEILNLKGGSFSVERNVKTPKKTINMPFSNLMLEVYARTDEEKVDIPFEDWSIITEEVKVLSDEVYTKLDKEINSIFSFDTNLKGISIYDFQGNTLYLKGNDYKSLVLEITKIEAFSEGVLELYNNQIIYIKRDNELFFVIEISNTSLSLVKVRFNKIIANLSEIIKGGK